MLFRIWTSHRMHAGLGEGNDGLRLMQRNSRRILRQRRTMETWKWMGKERFVWRGREGCGMINFSSAYNGTLK